MSPSRLAAMAASSAALAFATPSRADLTPQTIPFSQSWSDVNQIVSDDSWAAVPGMLGIRGDNLTLGTGTDPQTIVNEEFTIDVMANQSSPNTNTTGGVAEFDGLPDATIALQGSGTADAPYVMLTLSTTGVALVRLSYNLRDIDGSPDNAVQPVALQYRVGSFGTFTNIPERFVADATAGPSATMETHISLVLPAEAGNQPVVQIRWITTNAAGSDEWVGVDDIDAIDASTSPAGSGSATPTNVPAGSSTQLQMVVAPGTFPSSTGLAVTGDLSLIGGASGQPLFDDGTHGDVTAGDNVFSFEATVPLETTVGEKVIPFLVSDAEGRATNPQITLFVVTPVGVSEEGVSAALAARAPFPNPFRLATSIDFETPEPSRVRVSVFDARGRRVAVLEDRDLPAGRHHVAWTGRDATGARVTSGVYFVRITTESDRVVRRVLLRD